MFANAPAYDNSTGGNNKGGDEQRNSVPKGIRERDRYLKDYFSGHIEPVGVNSIYMKYFVPL